MKQQGRVKLIWPFLVPRVNDIITITLSTCFECTLRELSSEYMDFHTISYSIFLTESDYTSETMYGDI